MLSWSTSMIIQEWESSLIKLLKYPEQREQNIQNDHVPDQNEDENYEQEPDQIVPEIQNPEPASVTKKKSKKRKTKKNNFGNKAKKRNQRNYQGRLDYRKFSAIRVQPQDYEIDNVPLDDIEHAEPVEDNSLPQCSANQA